VLLEKTKRAGKKGKPLTYKLPLHQKPGKKYGKPGQVCFNHSYQAFVKRTSLVRLVLADFQVSLVELYLKSLVRLV